ncbi:ABC transporter substrate-binding protein [Methyloligella sp. 2.7D]|uniref:ABC transporter substrate-binding protein n=1 Tax=unclassified Methyloligella TaxID=2625955 RepID=UPI00157C7B24|nr:ABC transporter substrate-binding protein [Methyloligella sp. GL2]QKP78056.1 ABC transporter substrate-binding protein [Methyloligella sp. GL2]
MLSSCNRYKNSIAKLLAGLAIVAFSAGFYGTQPSFGQESDAAAASSDKAAEPNQDASKDAPKKAAAKKPKTVFKVVYLGKKYPEPPPLTIAEDIVTDKGIQGARVGIDDNNRTGQFTGQEFELVEAIIPADGDIVAKAKEVLKDGDALIVADLEPKDLLAVADLPQAQGSVILNIRDSDDKLRQKQCRYNVFHIIPSWAMRADAVAQYLIVKKWPRWFLIKGKAPSDEAFAKATERSAKRFGGKIVEDRVYKFETGSRRLDSGHQQVQSQMALATQGAPEHDIIWVADTQDGFGEYLMYRSYTPRPVVGTQGMRPVAWDDSYTEYGGMAFQRALRDKAHRKAVERDYTAWLAIRAIGEATVRSGKTAVKDLRDYMLSDKYKVAGFKGEAMNFRSWNHQLRQPVLLAGQRTIVSVSPQEGFLHPKYLTDTLGFDERESLCEFKQK